MRDLPYRIRLRVDRSDCLDGAPELDSPEAVYELVRRYLEHSDREHLLAVCLDAKNRVLGVDEAAVGGVNETTVHPGNFARAALATGAAQLVMVHNHPSGDPQPSSQDVGCTKTVQRALALIDVELIDHVIVGNRRFYSMAEAGLITRGRRPAASLRYRRE